MTNGGSMDQPCRPLPHGRRAVAAERARRFIKRHPTLLRTSERFWRGVDGLPKPIRAIFNPLREPMLRETRWSEVLVVIEALESAAVPYWLAGGWGVDALVEKQTRRHKDLDVVIEGFQDNEPHLRRILLALGFHHVNMDTGGVWMPKRSNFENMAGHRVEFLEIDWDHLRSVFALDPEKSARAALPKEELFDEIFTVGTLNARRVPCLTTAAQLFVPLRVLPRSSRLGQCGSSGVRTGSREVNCPSVM